MTNKPRRDWGKVSREEFDAIEEKMADDKKAHKEGTLVMKDPRADNHPPQHPTSGKFSNKYSDEDRLKACNAYFTMFGNAKKVSAYCQIPYQTIRSWTKTEWWAEMAGEVRQRHQDKMDGRFTGLITKLADEIEDRIENGDQVVHVKTGELIAKPISLRDGADALQKIMMQRALMRGEPTSRSATVKVEEQLDKIEERLVAKGKKDKEELKNNAVH